MKSKQTPLKTHPTIQIRLHTHNKETGPVWPSLPSRLAQWTARSLSSLPVMQRSCLLLHRAAMLSEWKPGVSERNWGRNPWPSTLSAGEYHLIPGRGSTGNCLFTHLCGIAAMAALRGAKDAYFLRLKRLPIFLASFLPLCRSSAPDSSRAFVSIRVTGTCIVARSADR